ncbi:MAG TPA: ABC transporter permease [Streptosporangiaceae bacterium]|nr:ABC transporter permease [Streptosporangiaceae bacterium]
MRAAWLICRKDLKARLRDRSALLIGIVVPLGLAFIFNAIFSGISGSAKVISLGVVNADQGVASQQFTSQVLPAVGRSGLISIQIEPTVSRARALAAKGSLAAVIVIPAGFSARVQAGQPASMQVIGNVDAPVSTEVARSIAESYAADLNRVRLSVATVAATTRLPPARIQALAAQVSAASAPVAVTDVSAQTRELNQKSFFAAGMAVFFLFFTVQFGVTSLLEERNDGTLARLLAAPISRASILGAKLLTSFLLGVISMAVLVAATTLLFGATWGNPVGVSVLIVTAIMAATGIMALIATVARNAEQAANWQSVVAVILGLIGGTFFPVSQAPGILSSITFVAPQAWFLRGLGDLRGGSVSVVWVPALAMLGFAAVTGGLALFRLRRLAEV